MKLKNIGQTDLKVAPIAFGGNVFGWTLDEKASFEILDVFAGNEYNLIDTANNYSYWVEGNHGGESEEIIGKWMKDRKKRHEVVIATKVGGRGKNRKQTNASRAHILAEVDASLKRLQTDYIDLYQLHYDDLSTPIEETLVAFQELIQQGKVRWIGVSNISAARLEESLKISSEKNLPKYQTLQPHYNLYESHRFEDEYQKIALDHHLDVLPYYALASGFLTGKYRSADDLSKSARGKDVEKYLNERGFKILAALDEVSRKHGVNPAAISLAWLLHQPSILAPIASATNRQQMETLLAAPNIHLDESDLERLKVD